MDVVDEGVLWNIIVQFQSMKLHWAFNMKAPESPSNIYEVFYPVCWAFKLTGMFPFSFQGSARKGVLHTTFWDVILFTSWVSFGAFLLFFDLYSFHDVLSLTTKILDLGGKCNVILGIFAIFVCCFYTLRKRNNLRKFFELLRSFDDKVWAFKSYKNLKTAFFRIFRSNFSTFNWI